MNRTSAQIKTQPFDLEDTALVDRADETRLRISPLLNAESRATLGQFMTPGVIADFMASLFEKTNSDSVRILDAGAGVGTLSAALVARFAKEPLIASVDVTAYEIDQSIRNELVKTLKHCSELDGRVSSKIIPDDFIESAVNEIQFGGGGKYTHAILNPPYRKINVGTPHRNLLSEVGIETVNLYSAFVALAIERMEQGGQIVAIIPRSFCNGPYYKPFRKFLFERTALKQIHLFDSRTSAFSDDAVLQENVIIRLTVGKRQGDVVVSSSADRSMIDLNRTSYGFRELVLPDDAEKFLHIPQNREKSLAAHLPMATENLKDIGLKISTGPVVDFRLKEFLLSEPSKNSVPLLYANHFVKGTLVWPRREGKKPNAIMVTDETSKWLYPNGCYTILRRFSSKEEKRRIVAYVVHGTEFGASSHLGFENHLNVFHDDRRPLNIKVALGLAVFLNSTAVDEYFRRFSGHTQVNATDLKNLKYPSQSTLIKLGCWAANKGMLSQEAIDIHIKNYV